MSESTLKGILKGLNLTVGKGGIIGYFKSLLLTIASKKRVAPEYYTNREWAIKQSIFPMEMFVLACQANGLSTNIMEGFDGHRLSKMINCPKRYFISGVVPFGYAKDISKKPTLRYESSKLIYSEKFGNGFTGIEEFKRKE